MNYLEVLADWQRKHSYTDEQLERMYFSLKIQIDEAYKKRDFRSVETLSRMCVTCIPGMVRSMKVHHGGFGVADINAIDHYLYFGLARGARGQVQNIMELLSGIPELKPWAERLSPALHLMKVSEFIRSHDETRQSDLRKHFPEIETVWISRLVRYMEMAGTIERQKTGNTKRINLTEGKQDG